jgi:predicted MFS family arabinose efflux permease
VGARGRLLTPALARVFAISLGALTSFCLLLSVVPLYVTSGGAGTGSTGLVTGALFLATVAGELVTPRLTLRFGNRWVLGAGLVLLGAPLLVLALVGSSAVAVVLAVCLVRGLGFAVVVIVSGSLVASLVPPERRGEGLGLYGIVVGIPAVVALPLGVWLADQIGFATVFVAGGVAAVSGLLILPGLPCPPSDDGEGPVGLLDGMRNPALTRPVLVFSATALAAGLVVSFLPLAVTTSGALVTLALLVQAVSATASRWWAGRHGDRHGAAGLLLPSLVVCAAGVATLVLVANAVAVIVAMILFGAGFGVAQNASLSLMLDRVGPPGYGTSTALWNLAYDASMGIGAAGFGFVAGATGYPTGFALAAALMLVAVVPALHDRRSPTGSTAPVA